MTKIENMTHGITMITHNWGFSKCTVSLDKFILQSLLILKLLASKGWLSKLVQCLSAMGYT